ncbi:MAG TPA: alpha/beta fold hydrolase [Pyrinomonadaceae bacterium]|jgi:pimeloyl-ACP methyl ester carboxylesterase|nr:alpha/beta fold hydrolase [Pyrinomonadaceae bacterium]
MGKLRTFWKGLVAGGAGVAALAAVNAAVARDAPGPETGALGGESGTYAWKHGQVFYRHAGAEDAPPVLFIHGIGAGARSFMWRRNFLPLSRDFRTYAVDLLGFGYSDKPASAPYSSDLYVEMLSDFLGEVVGRPAALVAHGLSAAFAARVADEHAELVRSLVLISPTGADTSSARPGVTGAAFYGLLHSPVLGTSFYNAVTSERSVRDYARNHLFYEKRFATPRLVAHYYAVSHLPGAQHAATAFLSGYFNTDIREPFARLRQPVTLAWGRQDTANPLEQAGQLLGLNSRARLEVFDRCRQMPQEEHAEHFNALLREALRESTSLPQFVS